jgi:hypothetical protein
MPEDTLHPDADANAVRVFTTDDAAVLPLATMALETEGIAFQVKHAGKADSMNWLMGQTPTTRPVVLDIFVAPDAAARAKELLADLSSQPAQAVAAAQSAPLADGSDPPAIYLEHAATGANLGTISEAQLQELTSHLDEQGPQEYRIDDSAIRQLESSSADPTLVDLLRTALAGASDLVIRWAVR